MMKRFTEGFNHAVLLPGVGREITHFLVVERRLIQVHSEEVFPFLKVFHLHGHEDLAPAKFPKLYNAVNVGKQTLDNSFRDYQSSKESLF